jgi:hypothetical protein
MTKPADVRAKARERSVQKFWNEWCRENDIEAAEGWLELTPKQAREFTAAFAESERSSAIKEAREECARAVCNRCARPDKYEFFNAETGQHRMFKTGQLFECRAAAIRALGEP